MSGKTITEIVNITGGWNSDAAQIYGQIFVAQNGTNIGNGAAYGSHYEGGVGLWSTNSTTTSSGCVTLSMTVPSTATSGVFDPTEIAVYGIQIGSGSGGTGFPVTVVADVSEWIYQ